MRRAERGEDQLRAVGYLVIRVSWDDLDHPQRLVRRIRQAFAMTASAAKTVANS